MSNKHSLQTHHSDINKICIMYCNTSEINVCKLS